MNIRYRNIECKNMTDSEIEATAKLFSEHYGKWSPTCSNPNLANKRIKYSSNRVRNQFCYKEDCLQARLYLYHISLDTALQFFYHSEVYTLLSEGISDMHCRSDQYLVEELRKYLFRSHTVCFVLDICYKFHKKS